MVVDENWADFLSGYGSRHDGILIDDGNLHELTHHLPVGDNYQYNFGSGTGRFLVPQTDNKKVLFDVTSFMFNDQMMNTTSYQLTAPSSYFMNFWWFINPKQSRVAQFSPYEATFVYGNFFFDTLKIKLTGLENMGVNGCSYLKESKNGGEIILVPASYTSINYANGECTLVLNRQQQFESGPGGYIGIKRGNSTFPIYLPRNLYETLYWANAEPSIFDYTFTMRSTPKFKEALDYFENVVNYGNEIIRTNSSLLSYMDVLTSSQIPQSALFYGDIDSLNNRYVLELRFPENCSVKTPFPSITPIPGMVGYWKYDEGSSCWDIKDSSGQGNHGRSYGLPYLTDGHLGRGMYYTGYSDSYTEIPNNSSFGNITSDYSISFWANNNGGNGGLVGTTNGADGGLSLLAGSSGEIYCRTSNGSGFTDSSTDINVLSINQWHHVASVKRGNSCRIFVDGIDKTRNSGNHSSLAGSNNALVIGGIPSHQSGFMFRGILDEIRLYNYALSASQIADDMNGLVPVPVTNTPTPTITPTPFLTFTPTPTPTVTSTPTPTSTRTPTPTLTKTPTPSISLTPSYTPTPTKTPTPTPTNTPTPTDTPTPSPTPTSIPGPSAAIYTCPVTDEATTQVSPDFFGMNNQYGDEGRQPLADRIKIFQQLKAAGITLVRFPINWWSIQPQQGVFNWSIHDEVVRAAQEEGIKFLIVVLGVPPWARPEGPDPRQLVIDPSHYDDWTHFVKEAVNRYNSSTGTVAQVSSDWEILNEPEQISFDGTPEDMLQTLNLAYTAIKEINPQSRVWSPSTGTMALRILLLGEPTPTPAPTITPISYSPDYFIKIVAEGKFDILTFHFYSDNATAYRITPLVKQYLRDHGNDTNRSAKVALTETNISPCQVINKTEQEMAELTVDRFACLAQAGADYVSYFKVTDWAGCAPPGGDKIKIKLGIFNDDGTPRTSYNALQQMVSALTTPTPTPISALTFTFSFEGVSANVGGKNVNVSFYQNGNKVRSEDVVTSYQGGQGGAYQGTLSNPPEGTFDIKIKKNRHLSRKLSNVTITSGTNTINFPDPLLAGDIEAGLGQLSDDTMNILDYNRLLSELASAPTTPVSDLNFDGVVNAVDYSIMSGNFPKDGV